MRQKARRGELFFTVAVGYVKTRHDRIERDPDLRVREAIGLVFRKFAEFQSIRQVHLWLRQSGSSCRPSIIPPIDREPCGSCRSTTPSTILTNPIYGGAYAFGRTCSRVTVEAGRKRVSRGWRGPRRLGSVDPRAPRRLHLLGGVQRNQRLIADNAKARGPWLAVRSAAATPCWRSDALRPLWSPAARLLQRDPWVLRALRLPWGSSQPRDEPCISFGGIRVDAAVAAETLRLLAPLGIEAALQAIEARQSDAAERRRQIELALTQARYEAKLARRQYERSIPTTARRSELERRGTTAWSRSVAWRSSFGRRSGPGGGVDGGATDRLLALGADIEAVWQHPCATAETRKRIIAPPSRDRRQAGRGHNRTRHPLARWRSYPSDGAEEPDRQHRWSTAAETGDLIRALARQQPDSGIAMILNRAGKRTGKGNTWTEARVRSFRNGQGIAVYREGEMAERGE